MGVHHWLRVQCCCWEILDSDRAVAKVHLRVQSAEEYTASVGSVAVKERVQLQDTLFQCRISQRAISRRDGEEGMKFRSGSLAVLLPHVVA